eukprot:2596548-Pyramimonas_sp.AAC.1
MHPEQRDQILRYPGALAEAAPFGTLHRLQIEEHYHLTGEMGPLWIFEGRRLGLLLACLAAKWRVEGSTCVHVQEPLRSWCPLVPCSVAGAVPPSVIPSP